MEIHSLSSSWAALLQSKQRRDHRICQSIRNLNPFHNNVGLVNFRLFFWSFADSKRHNWQAEGEKDTCWAGIEASRLCRDWGVKNYVDLVWCKTSSSSKQHRCSNTHKWDEATLWSFLWHDCDETASLQWGVSSSPPIKIKSKQSRKHAKLGMKLFRSPLDRCFVRICSSQSMQHIQIVVKPHYSLDKLKLFCFLIDIRPQTQSFQNISSHNLVNKNEIALFCQHERNLVKKNEINCKASRPNDS